MCRASQYIGERSRREILIFLLRTRPDRRARGCGRGAEIRSTTVANNQEGTSLANLRTPVKKKNKKEEEEEGVRGVCHGRGRRHCVRGHDSASKRERHRAVPCKHTHPIAVSSAYASGNRADDSTSAAAAVDLVVGEDPSRLLAPLLRRGGAADG